MQNQLIYHSHHSGIVCIYWNIYVMCAMWGDKVLTQQWYASNDVDLLQKNSAHGHQLKVGQSCGDGS